MITLHTGTEMPVLGLGTWQLTGTEAAKGVRHALDIGYRLVDTADDYHNQREIGNALRSASVERRDVFLVSKIEEDEDAYAATQDRLTELGIEQLDLCLIHRPPAGEAGESMWKGLIQAKRDGLTKEIGVSNYSSRQIDRLIETTGEVPVVNQIEWSPFGHSDAAMEHAASNDIVIQAYSPLTRTERLNDRVLGEIAAANDRTPAQVVLRWDLQVGVATVPKAASPDHRKENLDVFDFELDGAEMRRLASLNERYSSLSGLPYV